MVVAQNEYPLDLKSGISPPLLLFSFDNRSIARPKGLLDSMHCKDGDAGQTNPTATFMVDCICFGHPTGK